MYKVLAQRKKKRKEKWLHGPGLTGQMNEVPRYAHWPVRTMKWKALLPLQKAAQRNASSLSCTRISSPFLFLLFLCDPRLGRADTKKREKRNLFTQTLASRNRRLAPFHGHFRELRDKPSLWHRELKRNVLSRPQSNELKRKVGADVSFILCDSHLLSGLGHKVTERSSPRSGKGHTNVRTTSGFPFPCLASKDTK